MLGAVGGVRLTDESKVLFLLPFISSSSILMQPNSESGMSLIMKPHTKLNIPMAKQIK